MPTLIISIFFILLSQTHSLNQEGLYLQSLKHTLDDPTNTLSDWNPRHDTPCNWTGVGCDVENTSVISLSLPSSNLYGPFPLILCRLHSLSKISFFDNFINSTLPSGISDCINLNYLNLASNLLVGPLPDTLPLLTKLEFLDLSSNNFSGDVPPTFANFERLKIISLVENLLDGSFPLMLFNVTTLTTFNVSYNPWTPTSLTSQVANLVNLEYFWVSNSSLIGELPDSFRQLTKLKNFDVACNRLTGKFPSWITELVNLQQAEFYSNQFYGQLPTSGWEKMTSLRNFDAAMNNINGTIPVGLARLPLASFNMYENQLEGELPKVLANSPNLYELKLYSNKLSGELPRKLGENSPLVIIDVSDNNFTGRIPPNLCSHGALNDMLMMQNLFSGGIPKSFANCRSLSRVRVGDNMLSGIIPFWGLPHLSLLEIMRNSFSGEIPKSIGLNSNLTVVNISDNKIRGQIPEEIGNLSRMTDFLASDNQLSGPLPTSLFTLEDIATIDLFNNELTGQIPSDINKFRKIFQLNFGRNKLSGEIPPEIGTLHTLSLLDLSNNMLTGGVPSELQGLRVNTLNCSYNQLSGELPAFFNDPRYSNSFLGNPRLCLDTASHCDRESEVKSRKRLWLFRIVCFLASIVTILGIVLIFLKFKLIKQGFINQVKCTTVDKSKWTLMSFHKLDFNEYEVLDYLDEDNVIGRGASGKVYKAVMSNGQAVAVKRMWNLKSKAAEDGDVEKDGGGGGDGDAACGRDNGFDTEVDTLGKIRHKNIVRLWCCCQTKDCKLLVYEYMPNGSLGDMLHGAKGGLLDWPTRYRIALDSAEGLSYLHHDCVPAIVHRDIKSNNILLDGEFCAKVADFGVAKTVDAMGKGTKSMSNVAGSCGYIAPEYGYTLRVNEKSDTYSFGVVILELVTGKRALDPEYGEKDLVKFVCTTIEQKGVDHIIDPKLDSCYKEEVCKLLNIGLHCTSPLPINRPSMRRVVKMLQEVGGEDMSKSGKDGKLTPYYPEEDASEHISVV